MQLWQNVWLHPSRPVELSCTSLRHITQVAAPPPPPALPERAFDVAEGGVTPPPALPERAIDVAEAPAACPADGPAATAPGGANDFIGAHFKEGAAATGAAATGAAAMGAAAIATLAPPPAALPKGAAARGATPLPETPTAAAPAAPPAGKVSTIPPPAVVAPPPPAAPPAACAICSNVISRAGIGVFVVWELYVLSLLEKTAPAGVGTESLMLWWMISGGLPFSASYHAYAIPTSKPRSVNLAFLAAK
jgi:hypothetical protein